MFSQYLSLEAAGLPVQALSLSTIGILDSSDSSITPRQVYNLIHEDETISQDSIEDNGHSFDPDNEQLLKLTISPTGRITRIGIQTGYVYTSK